MISITKAELRERMETARPRTKRVYSRFKPDRWRYTTSGHLHALCPACNLRIMAKDAPRCYQCAPRSPEMLELERTIASGRPGPTWTWEQYLEWERAHSVIES